jgi:hypothetical protein
MTATYLKAIRDGDTPELGKDTMFLSSMRYGKKTLQTSVYRDIYSNRPRSTAHSLFSYDLSWNQQFSFLIHMFAGNFNFDFSLKLEPCYAPATV